MTVLVSYLEKNKVFKLEENPVGGDIALLKNLSYSSNLSRTSARI